MPVFRSVMGNHQKLVGGWTNPFEKYESKWVHLPQIGMKIKNIWNHRLVMVGRNNPSNLLKGKLAVRYFSCHRLENNNKTHPRRVESSPCVFFLFSEGRLRNVHGHNEGHLDSTNPSIPRGAFRCRWVLEPPFFAPINARKYHGVTGVKCNPQPCPRSYKKNYL